MKYLLLILLLSGCATVQSPCNDTRFVYLQSKPLDSLTIAEYDYVLRKEKECDEFRRHDNTNGGLAIASMAVIAAVLYLILHK